MRAQLTDTALARLAEHAAQAELAIKGHWEATPADDMAERDAALVAGRQATALRKMCERWITARVTRAALHR